MRLSDQAILVSLRISQWSGKATERNGAREIEKAKGAKSGVVTARKTLMPDFPELEAVQKFNTALRTWFNDHTLTWDEGTRLKKVDDAQEFMLEIGERMKEGEALADAAAIVYPAKLDQAERDLGNLWDPKLYPSAAEIRSKFGYRFTPAPVPDTNDLRNMPGFSQEEMDKVVAQANAGMQAQIASAVKDVWERIHGVTSAMHERLATHDAVFRDSLVGNVEELVSLLPKLNLFNDPDIEDMCKSLKSGLIVHPQSLRDSPHTRANVAEKARLLAERAKSYL